MQGQYPRFIEAIRSLGATHEERSRALNVSTKTIERYLAGEIPEPLEKLLRAPELLIALAADATNLDLAPTP
jgi:hypothetical protein